MATQEYGLTKLILIDSYLPGKRYIVDLNGQINITGENGIGKTSLIKLPVIFYGEQPSKLGIQHNVDLNYKGFSGRYLPRDGSYVIFEYLAAGTPCCVVFLPDNKTEEGLERLFVASAYQDALFFNAELTAPVTKATFLQRLTEQKIASHNPRSYKNYRAILLDGTVRQLTHFSMVPKGTKMARLYDLFSGMLKRTANFDVLSHIIEGWAHHDIAEDAIEHLQNFRLDKSQLRSWIHEYQAQQQLQQATPATVLQAIKQHYASYRFNQGMMFSVLEKVKQCRITNQQMQQQASSHYEQQQQTQQTQLSQLKQQESNEQKIIHTKQQVLNELNAKIANLNTRKQTFEQDIGNHYQSELNKQQQQQQRLQQQQERLDVLHRDLHDIQSWYEHSKTILQAQFQQQRSTYQLQLSELNTTQLQATHALQTQHHAHIERLKEQYHQQQQQQQQAINHLEKQQLSLQQQHLQPPEDFIAQQDALQEKQQRLYQEHNQLNEQRDHQTQAVQHHKAQYDKLNRDYTAFRNDIDVLEEEIYEIEQKLHSDEHSLLSFLKQHVPNWEQSFGKIVRKDVLLHPRLQPELLNNNTHSLFGVAIHTDDLPLLEYQDERLQQQHAEKVDALQQAEADLKPLEQHMSKIQRQWQHSQQTLDELNQQLIQLKPQLATLQKQQRHLKTTLQQWHTEQHQQQQQQLEPLQQQLYELQQQQQQQQQQQTQRLNEQQQTYEQAQQQLQTQQQSAYQAIVQDEHTVGDREQQALTELAKTRASKLSTHGVDSTEINQLEQTIAELTEQVNDLNQLQKNVSAYQLFLQQDYQQLPPLQTEQHALNGTLEQLHQTLANIRTQIMEHSSEQQALEAQHHDQQRLYQQELHLLREIEQQGFIDAPHAIVIDDPLEHITRAKTLMSTYQEAKQLQQTHKTQLMQLMTPIKVLFIAEGSKGTSLHHYWINHQPADSNDLIATLDCLLNYLENDHRNNDIRSLCNQLNTLDKLNNYVDYIRNFNHKIHFFNQQLDQQMQQVTQFESLESLRASVYFTLTETQSWQDMENLSKAYSHWLDSKRQHFHLDDHPPTLPDSELFTTLEDYVQNTKEEQLSIHQLAQHIDFRLSFLDKGQERRVKSTKQLSLASSNALSYLILVVLFIGFVNMIRQQNVIPFVWALDELTDISKTNIDKLLALLKENHIHLISACPDVDDQIYDLFDKTYELYADQHQAIQLREVITETAPFAFEEPHEL